MGADSSIPRPELANSLLELSGILGVDRNRLSALRYRADAPPTREDRKFDVEEWRAYLETLAFADDENDHDQEYQRLKREYLKVKTDREKFELMKKRGHLLTLAEHLAEIREIIDQVKWLVQTVPTRAALLTTDEGVRNSIRDLCAHLEKEFAARLDAAAAKAAEAEKQAEADKQAAMPTAEEA